MNKVTLAGIAIAIAIGITVIALTQSESSETFDVPSGVDIQEEPTSAGKNISIKLSESLSMKSNP